ncbi:carbamoyltransferase [Thermocatellispora tengchongensis]|uniref:Carbamoyltransferase n=1 Tax=Thermocatellispora tengchongensis TaxID=1073253 RepID=A0A840PLR2_9ACTN|nr:carbamoyltransferase C-terminal domain-containing protein [Thermocatellispora tengchongensis]MBB5138570.1 carbamoyltransferase [Thermocatellispora tengchongensis]
MTRIVVGINRTQDGSIAVARGEDEVYSLQKERISRRKHHWGRLGDLPDRYLPHMPLLKETVDLVVEGYSSDAEIAHLADYHEELRETLSLREDTPIIRVSHHLTHLYSAFPPSPFQEAAGLVVDAQGSPVRDFTEPVELPPGTGPDMLEISSFYRCERGRVECLAKQLWDGDWARPAGLGCFYSLLTRMLWPEGEGNEGKVMGLAPYGDPGALGLPPLDVRGHEVHIPPEWLAVFQGDRDGYRYGEAPFARCANLAAAGQRAFEDALSQLVRRLHERAGSANLVFAGGTALNCSANGILIRESPFQEIFIPPSPHDGGTAVGCALYGLIEHLGIDSRFRWRDDFLGPEPDESAIAAAVRGLPGDLVAERPEDLIAAMAELLESGRVVGLHHGRSESGPRALGHRSVLGDPRLPQMRDYINFEVKGREWFRPLAPLVLAEHAPRIFDVDRPAPFMQYAADVRPEHRDALPGITHVDGTARLQTVTEDTTPFLHALLRRWHERTGCPVLINTSLNGPGAPLTETPEHSIETLRATHMHALAMPPYLIRKRNEPPVPGRDWPPAHEDRPG